MVKIDRTPTPPESLAREKAKENGNYNCDDVIMQLAADFHKKCYLCEIDKLQSVEVEHLRAHHGGKDKERKFDWNNLFYSCRHCNNVKNKREYDELILDCCREDPEKVLDQKFIEGHVVVDATDDSDSAKLTAKLLKECFEQTNTGIRVLECETRVTALKETMNLLYKTLEKYGKKPSERTKHALEGMLSRSYRFSGFTRTYVRMNQEKYPDLIPYITLSVPEEN